MTPIPAPSTNREFWFRPSPITPDDFDVSGDPENWDTSAVTRMAGRTQLLMSIFAKAHRFLALTKSTAVVTVKFKKFTSVFG